MREQANSDIPEFIVKTSGYKKSQRIPNMPTFNRKQVLKPGEKFNPADPTPLLSKRPLLEWS